MANIDRITVKNTTRYLVDHFAKDKVTKIGTQTSFDFLEFESGLKIAYGVRNCSITDITSVAGGFYRGREILDLSAVFSEVIVATASYANSGFGIVTNVPTNKQHLELFFNYPTSFSNFNANIGLLIIGRK